MGLEEARKKCSRCGVDHPLYFFRKKGKRGYGYVPRYEAICKECESKERIAKRDANPFKPKAREAIARHAKQEKMSPRQFSHEYGITLDYVQMLFRDAWLLHENGSKCHSCFKPFKGSLDDFTLDKIFPDQPPTHSNLRVICRTCNTAKGIKNPIQYDLESIEYDRNKEAVKRGIQFQLAVKAKDAPPEGKQGILKTGEQLKLFQVEDIWNS